MDNAFDKIRFLDLLRSTKREGIEDLICWIESTDFFSAPASTRYHDSFEGGLLQHSLRVYDWLKALADFYSKTPLAAGPLKELTPDSIILVALCHDFCKIGCYKTEMRWRKDQHNRWEQYPTYKFEEDFAFGGHGSKSVFLVQHFIKLTPTEAAAINCHMGATDESPYGKTGAVFDASPLAWLLHVADEAASFNIKED